MIYQARFSLLPTFSRVFLTMRDWVRWVVDFLIFGQKGVQFYRIQVHGSMSI